MTINSSCVTVKLRYVTMDYDYVTRSNSSNFISFRECCSHSKLQPVDCIITSSPANFVNEHAIDHMTYGLLLHTQRSDEARPHFCRLERQRFWPLKKWFSRDHDHRGRGGCSNTDSNIIQNQPPTQL